MTTIFSILNDLMHKKNGNLHKQHDFPQAVKSPYLLQRWVSMATTDSAYIVNETTNKIYAGLNNNSELWYKLYFTLLPKTPSHKKTAYIKKSSEKINEKTEEIITILQNRNQLSRREVEACLDLENQLGNDTAKYEKLLK